MPISDEKYAHLLEVHDLYTSFNIPAGEVRSVNGISFNVDKGKVLGIVGESGSGKSVTAYSIMQILQNPGRVVGGSIKFEGQELLGLPHSQLQKIRGEKISIIFQDPMSSLNPVYTIGNQIIEAIKLHPVKRIVSELRRNVNRAKRNLKTVEELYKKNKTRQNRKNISICRENLRHAKYELANYPYNRALEMLRLVGINEPAKRLKQYPFEFSGGMLQRIMIAMSLVCEPDLLIADEPTTALDVTIQAQILELLKKLQKRMGMGIIIITHDLGVVAQVCDEVDVMYAGRIVEKGTVEEIFYNPKHEYTKGLMKSIPQANDKRERLVPIEGNPVDVFCLPKGCSFAPRCSSCMKVCLKKYPRFVEVNKNHQTACFKYYAEAYVNKKIRKDELKQLVNQSSVGNAAFTPISIVNVLDAKNDYELAKRMYEHAALKSPLTKKEKELIYHNVKAKKDEYDRVRKDLKQAAKAHKVARNDLPSMERGDMVKHIKEAKKRVKYVDDMLVNKQVLFNYLAKLNISSYPVNYHFHREDVALAKNEYQIYKTFTKGLDPRDKMTRSKVLTQIDAKKKIYEQSLDIYSRSRRVTKALLKTRVKLIKINAKRVMKVIKTNADNAYKEFKQKHLMFINETQLHNYLNGFIYAHWDLDETMTRKKCIELWNIWQKKQAEINRVRKQEGITKIDNLIREKNRAMYTYWFKRYDYRILKYYRIQKARFERLITTLDKKNHKYTRLVHHNEQPKQVEEAK